MNIKPHGVGIKNLIHSTAKRLYLKLQEGGGEPERPADKARGKSNFSTKPLSKTSGIADHPCLDRAAFSIWSDTGLLLIRFLIHFFLIPVFIFLFRR
jgi:hypothetical protein